MTAGVSGRNDGNAPSNRQKNWRSHLSKRAKKRFKAKVAKSARHANRGKSLARRTPTLPPAERMEEDMRMNSMMVDVLKMEVEGPPTPREGE